MKVAMLADILTKIKSDFPDAEVIYIGDSSVCFFPHPENSIRTLCAVPYYTYNGLFAVRYDDEIE